MIAEIRTRARRRAPSCDITARRTRSHPLLRRTGAMSRLVSPTRTPIVGGVVPLRPNWVNRQALRGSPISRVQYGYSPLMGKPERAMGTPTFERWVHYSPQGASLCRGDVLLAPSRPSCPCPPCPHHARPPHRGAHPLRLGGILDALPHLRRPQRRPRARFAPDRARLGTLLDATAAPASKVPPNRAGVLAGAARPRARAGPITQSPRISGGVWRSHAEAACGGRMRRPRADTTPGRPNPPSRGNCQLALDISEAPCHNSQRAMRLGT